MMRNRDFSQSPETAKTPPTGKEIFNEAQKHQTQQEVSSGSAARRPCNHRDADRFDLLLNQVVADGEINIESVAPVDDDLSAVYQYLIGSV